MRKHGWMGTSAAVVLLALAGCESEEPAVQDSAIDEGGVYEDGALEQVQPVEPEVLPDTTAAAPGVE